MIDLAQRSELPMRSDCGKASPYFCSAAHRRRATAQAKLLLTAHEVYLPKPKLAVEGPGGVQASFDFRGAKNDVAGRMVTVTLTNDLDGTVYA